IGLESGVNYLYGPGINEWDMSLQKQFSIKERVRLQFRADAFNAFNHTQFSVINSTVNFASLSNCAPTHLYLNAAGTVHTLTALATGNGSRSPRIMQLVIRLQF